MRKKERPETKKIHDTDPIRQNLSPYFLFSKYLMLFWCRFFLTEFIRVVRKAQIRPKYPDLARSRTAAGIQLMFIVY